MTVWRTFCCCKIKSIWYSLSNVTVYLKTPVDEFLTLARSLYLCNMESILLFEHFISCQKFPTRPQYYCSNICIIFKSIAFQVFKQVSRHSPSCFSLPIYDYQSHNLTMANPSAPIIIGVERRPVTGKYAIRPLSNNDLLNPHRHHYHRCYYYHHPGLHYHFLQRSNPYRQEVAKYFVLCYLL